MRSIMLLSFKLYILNKPKVLKLILEKGANINLIGEEHDTPLTRSALEQNIVILKLLLPYADQDHIDRSGTFHAKTPLGLAFHFIDLEMIELLLKYKANPFANDGEGYLTIENIPKNINEGLRKEIFNLIDKYKAK